MSRRRRVAPERLDRLHDLKERFTQVGTVDAVLVDEEAGEDRVVECTPGIVVGVPVQRPYIGKQSEALRQDVGTRGERRTASRVIGFEPRAILAQLVQALADLVLRQSFLGQVDKALLTLVEVGEAPGE
ncbi:hypothetical protein [Nocardioides litoris]|uniref:hypothetical protein n=1 Tax=Nocardioides litoris TaxID=1926648 RepID=UPI00112066D3|nr:hypothetical protein [Nocardioides litoris]